jgi:glycosyltransferase involved in cell wall biosynthesis
MTPCEVIQVSSSSACDRLPHVLYLIDVLWGMAGAEGALLRTVQLLPKDRYRCSVATFRLRPGLPLLTQFPCPVHEFPLTTVFAADAFRTAMQIRRFIRSEHVDIVHTFFETSDLWGGLVARLSGVPVLVSSRRDMGILRSRRHRLAYRLLRPIFDQVQAVSSTVRDQAISSEGLDPKKVVVVPNGIDTARLKAVPESSELRRTWQLDNTVPLITTVSHIRRVKGLEVFLRAAARVCQVRPETIFLIVGGIHEPDYMAALQRLVRELNLARNVRFLGKQDQAMAWAVLKMSSVFCLLSHSEGMSNALLEAMACGLPCVATAVGGTPEVVEDQRTGYLVPAGDPDAAAQKILILLDSPHLAQSMGQAGRLAVETQFSLKRAVERMTSQYNELLAAHHSKVKT